MNSICLIKTIRRGNGARMRDLQKVTGKKSLSWEDECRGNLGGEEGICTGGGDIQIKIGTEEK